MGSNIIFIAPILEINEDTEIKDLPIFTQVVRNTTRIWTQKAWLYNLLLLLSKLNIHREGQKKIIIHQPKLSTVITRRSQLYGVSAANAAWRHGLPQRGSAFDGTDLAQAQCSPQDPPQLVVSWNLSFMAPTSQHQLTPTCPLVFSTWPLLYPFIFSHI